MLEEMKSLESSSMSPLFQNLRNFLNERQTETESILPDRKRILTQLSESILESFENRSKATILFVCTQNSRRSQISQIFGAAIPQFLGIPGIKAFSGGTEISAFHPNAITALESIGFRIENEGPPRNPKYSIRWADGTPALIAFSKKFSDPPNPHRDFIVIMVCSTADEACPYVAGAEARISLPFEDPKSADDTPEVISKYTETCERIARELLFTFQLVKNKI
ncbi:low molecular weight phosphotyrosine protein phosphatase domain protein [Leptospira broomii serovar Hurstbridge str. 5399]|uniref:Low molecular weight phosphotyrosine protein phosphatase domain protein n=1 Tax=Leptospira broomii serovar Hurstbridge str. 5399 TaxID=1049789 RepID=T0GGI7_9LEPT|nr:low molecular weight phosphotyrosine protein phosphatase domain protein [Leptospira broomii serovar Hurstbridge str. 5399]